MPLINRLNALEPDFSSKLNDLLRYDDAQDEAIESAVANILKDVQQRGDAAVIEYTQRFDQIECTCLADLVISQEECQQALQALPAEQKQALEAAAQRVRQYHERQLMQSWHYQEDDGTVLGQQVTAMDRVGLYVPGGKAAYPSSVLMNAIPAKVAGVKQIIMTTPTPHGQRNPLVLAAAAVAGVDQVLTIGGAQAIAALAYGTQSMSQVDKIVGPGNAFVAAAKRRVFGTVGIDMVAGPSEILIICDGHTEADWIAMDLFSQAEHDELAQAILLSPDPDFLAAVEASIARQLPQMPRQAIIASSLAHRGALIQVKDLAQACTIANQIAPEHLELSVQDPSSCLAQIRHAGAIFLGPYSSEALGDYCAGPNHVLPTARTARFSSPLGVYDFQKRSSLIQVSAQGAQHLGQIAATLAQGEGLPAHAASAQYRIKKG
ncbi:histidinol dehydrogenase [Brackiella oedipodis]|uniref:histidinol dehydrogenase n=1 Tax=Brackiella oedipodis TaxID=124225 RepID=UPI000491961C|nr:histidinol dehydrogenase [Brackiella oedipodis]